MPSALGTYHSCGLATSARSGTAFSGKLNKLQRLILDYEEENHTKMYQQSDEVLLSYICIDVVTESIFSEIPMYPSRPIYLPVGASYTKEEL